MLDLFFKVPDPRKISGRPDKLEWWVQIDWAIVEKSGLGLKNPELKDSWLNSLGLKSSFWPRV